MATTLVVVSLVGCGSFSHEDAPFVASNQSRDAATAIVNGTAVRNLAPSETARFTVRIEVAYSRQRDYSYGPSQVDKRVEVEVRFKNLRTNALSDPVQCTAGAKLVTSIAYETSGRASCRTLDTYGKVVDENGGGSQ